MKMKCSFAAVLALSVATTAIAEIGGDSVTKKPDGSLEIKSTVLAPNGCYSKGSETSDAPTGERKIENAILVTFTLKHSGAPVCTQAVKPVAFSVAVKPPKDAQAVIVYVSDPRTKSITARAFALPK